MRGDLISVEPALLKQFMLDDMYARVTARLPRPLPGHVEQLLADGLDSDAAALARAGYLTRIAETDRFEAARHPMPWLSSLLAEGDGDAPKVAAELARAEPPGKPSPTDPKAMTWQVPGPGGHVRWFLASRWSGGDEERRRVWLYGFFLRCCGEQSLGS